MLFTSRQLYQILMGCVASQPIARRQNLIVASLNYCGIMNSPFEFYIQDQHKGVDEINKIFKQLVTKRIPGFNFNDKKNNQWKGSNIDQKFRMKRYSPMFDIMVGINRGKLMSRAQFLYRWDKVYQAQAHTDFQKEQFQKIKQQEVDALRQYDQIMMQTLIRWVYGVSFQEAPDQDVDRYLQKLRPFHDLSFLNEERKVKKLAKNYSKLKADVFFFQQYTTKLKEFLERTDQFYIQTEKLKDTLIVARKAAFINKPQNSQSQLDNLPRNIQDMLTKFQKTSFMFIDNFVFMGLHLKSKTEPNKQQIKDLRILLKDLRQHYGNKKQIIAGGDLNSFLNPDPIIQGYHMFPSKEEQFTTCKRRTATQSQSHKADKDIFQSKDMILSTLPFVDDQNGGRVMLINGKSVAGNKLLPLDDHPFDHYVVLCHIQAKQ